MRTLPLLSLGLLVVAAVSISSCRPSRVYADKRKTERQRDRDYDDRERDREYDRGRDYDPGPPPPPPSRTYSTFALIIVPTPGFVMKQDQYGRFYHRNYQGFLYWKGNDNRFYLDASYLNRVRYNSWEYDEWKRYSRNNSRRRY